MASLHICAPMLSYAGFQQAGWRSQEWAAVRQGVNSKYLKILKIN